MGAGPIGLEAALYARYLGYDVDLYERGRVADHVLRWGHLRMFTPFGLNRSPLGLAALRAQDAQWQAPADDAMLTGREFAERYLIPLAHSDLLVDGLHEQTKVVSVGRESVLKSQLQGEDRAEADFRLLLRSTDPADHGRERWATADVVIDATGTYGHPCRLGPGGLPALGESACHAHIEYGAVDVLGEARDRFASRNILLVGDSLCAASNLVALAELARQAPDTWITWVTPRVMDETAPRPVECLVDDPFADRQRLAQQANQLAASDANHITFYSQTDVESLLWHADLNRFSVRLTGKHAGEAEFDRVIGNVGFRSDLHLCEELQVGVCSRTGAPRSVNSASAEGSARFDHVGCPATALLQDEPDFYCLGAKSLGRDDAFLISLGLEQIRALFTILGDRESLNLYSTMSGLV